MKLLIAKVSQWLGHSEAGAAAEKTLAAAPPAGENKEEYLRELAQITQRGMRPADCQIIHQLVEGASVEDLCVVMNKTPDQVNQELARIRWKFRDLVQRHGFDKHFDPDVQGFIKSIQRALAR